MVSGTNRIVSLAKLFDFEDFVETGTQGGHLFRVVQGYFKRAFTIEIDGPPPKLTEDFGNTGRTFLYKGSSGEMLGSILKKHDIKRALFWLDAHGNETFFKDDGNNQVPKELRAIAQYAPDSLVIVDDIRKVNGKRWVNTSYEFDPLDWHVVYSEGVAILHRGGYEIPETF